MQCVLGTLVFQGFSSYVEQSNVQKLTNASTIIDSHVYNFQYRYDDIKFSSQDLKYTTLMEVFLP